MRDSEYITKSDVINFIRCPFAFHNARERGLTFNVLFYSPFAYHLMELGIKFEKEVSKAISWEKIQFCLEDEKCLRDDITVEVPCDIYNKELGIKGRPDQIATENGKLLPIEIKFHEAENETDPYEIAFYWLLLKPYRLVDCEPGGYYIFRGSGGKREYSSVSFEHVGEVLDIIRDIKRRKKFSPIRNRYCRDCTLFNEVCVKILLKRGDPSLLTSGKKSIDIFKELKFNLNIILQLSPQEIQNRLRERGCNWIGLRNITTYQKKAEAILNKKAISFGNDLFPEEDNVIFIDTEHYPRNSVFSEDGEPRIFAISITVKSGDKLKTDVIYDGGRKAIKIIKELNKITKKYNKAPIITWSGLSADLPALKEFMKRREFIELSRRHFDLFNFVKNNVAFPTYTNSIKDIASCIGYERKKKDMVGTDTFLIDAELKAVEKELKFVKTGKEKIYKRREELMKRLFEYCKDDTESLAYISDWIRERQRPKITEYDEKDVISYLKKAFKNCGNISIREKKNKSKGKYNFEIRFSRRDEEEIDKIIKYMRQLGFYEGCLQASYLPYYGKNAILRFIDIIDPEIDEKEEIMNKLYE